nr:ion channel [Parvularcula dongshanensis]
MVLLALHLAEVGAFAGAYELGRALGLGDFKEPAEADFMDIYYFSMATFTTLGLGKVMPTGHLASLAGLESFTGFLSISMSASAFFQWVQKEV